VIVFPWLALALAFVCLALVVASTPAGTRWLRSRGADEFVYPSLRAVAIVLVVLAAAVVMWYVFAGPAG